MILWTLLLVSQVATLNIQPMLKPVPFTAVAINDRFWSPRQKVNATKTLQHCFKMLKEYGNVHNLKLAIGGEKTGFRGFVFNDSDLYKVLEGAADVLAIHPNPELDKQCDELIDLIGKAQMADGYIDTYYEINAPDKRFTNLRDNHELYCAGHLIEGAVAHYKATGKKNFLNIALKLGGLLEKKFGPGGVSAYPGHPEVELALVKLSNATGDPQWLSLAEKFLNDRGNGYFAREHSVPFDKYDGTYWIDEPIRDLDEIKGHAVRAAYLMSGAADVAREDPGQGFSPMLDRVWESTVERRQFITGGIGPSGTNEGFTVDYDLPNLSAYQESCASIAMAMWGERMSLLHADGQYMDAAEAALYNGMLSGVSLDGEKFFYVNPLASQGFHHRQPWFDCACCPPNILRTIAAIGGYAYATGLDSLYVNLYIGGSLNTKAGSTPIDLDVATDYPWKGEVGITVKKAAKFALHLRVPGWCRGAGVSVNGEQFNAQIDKNYLVLDRSWSAGDVVRLDLPMEVEQILAHPYVKEDKYKVALRRGPLVYCAEETDNKAGMDRSFLPIGSKMTVKFRSDLFGGVPVIEAEGQSAQEPDWSKKLYAPLVSEAHKVTLIPYCLWDNREPGTMAVWLPTSPPVTRPELEAHAKITDSFEGRNSFGINNGYVPKASSDKPEDLFHFWPHKGGSQWVQYTWNKPVDVSGVSIYWLDDTGFGECRIPRKWSLEALISGTWTPVKVDGVASLNAWSEAHFPSVSCTALKLTIEQQPGFSSGILQWKVLSPK